MSKPSRDNVANGINGWDADVNNNFIRLFDRPIPIFLHTGDETDIASSFAPATYEESLVVIDDTQIGLTFYTVDKNHPSGSATWIPLTGRGSAKHWVIKTGTVTLTNSELQVVGNPGADAVYTLPPAAEMAGLTVRIKNTTAFDITVEGDGAELVDGLANLILDPSNRTGAFFCDGAQWYDFS